MFLSWTMVLLLPIAQADVVKQDYATEIRPLLERRCLSCHGALQQKGGLRLDTATHLRTGGDSGPSVNLADPQASLLLQRVTETDPAQRMPAEGLPLTAAEVAGLRAWITAGAIGPANELPQKDPREHWAYRPPTRPRLPDAVPPDSNPIDALLQAARQSKGLTVAPPVQKDLWLRRVTLNLIGLPATRAELHAFRDDHTDSAYESVVDRLLANPAHGERWARHWMDVWRYCDGYGRPPELLFSHHHIWRWRDWIVDSLNSGTGYDQMVMAMLAGDEMAPEDPDTLRATGFLARNWETFNRNKWIEMTVEHTSRAFLGTTIQCARCHDHKYDPIAQADYFRMRAVFEPHHIRIDRLPGQSDRIQHGLVRVFDDFMTTPTHLFIRGDEAQPDTSIAIQPGLPAAFGGSFEVRPVTLPVAAYDPDKRAFVIEEARAAADSTVAKASEAQKSAQTALQQALQSQTATDQALRDAELVLQSASKPEEQTAARAAAIAATEQSARVHRAVIEARQGVGRADAGLVAAEAAREALLAVLTVEKLEDEGAKASNSAVWSDAAQKALAAQRLLAINVAIVNETVAQQAVEKASVAVDGLIAAMTDPKEESLKAPLAKATTTLVELREKLAAASQQRAAAEKESGQPLTTDYKPRKLEYPRAKTTYREDPSSAPYSQTSTGRRLALARWIADRGNPLTARVAVNQIWARHFGQPLVRSVYDFGLRTPQPLHHELLDWLAVELMDSGWNMKHLHKLIVMSQTYRMQSSSAHLNDPNQAIDPDNHYYWRMNQRRMEAEVIRDSLLHLAGRLDPTRGGPALPIAAADEGLRRTIYYHHARDERMLFLTLFDPANIEECYRRDETIVPQQAIAFMNSKLVFDRADDIVKAVSAKWGEVNDADFISTVFEQLLGRSPSETEQAVALDGLQRLATLENSATNSATAPLVPAQTTAAGTAPAPGQPASTPQERARAALIHVLLNHNDFVSIR